MENRVGWKEQLQIGHRLLSPKEVIGFVSLGIQESWFLSQEMIR